MKNLVLTIACGDTYNKLAQITHPLIKAYAKRINADFFCIDDNNCSTPHWEKFRIYRLLNKYNRILYLDTDILVRSDAPNLFDIVPFDSLGMFNEAPFTNRSRELLIDTCKEYNITLSTWDGCYYNSGVMVVSRIHKQLFKKPKHENCSFYEQTYLNAIIAKNRPKIHSLDYKLNRMSCMDIHTGEHRRAAWFIHYAGAPSTNEVINAMTRDLKEWETNTTYSYNRNICIKVSGGLGDQINAEPAIRFADVNKIFGKDSCITVLTHFPRIFSHLQHSQLEVAEYGHWQSKEDTPYYVCESLPEPDTHMWSVVSNLLSHTVDFCSMALLKRILPLSDKQPILQTSLDDVAEILDITGIRNLNELVIIHPGRHWPSKTFPAVWWQEVIDKLAAKVPIGIVGQNEENRGIVDVIIPEGAYDFVDRLSLGAFFTLIKECNVLVSNDSSPVHVAGAFDTGIVLIPSCKHPEHILPWRYGNLWHRAVALYKRLTIDDVSNSPTEVTWCLGDKITKPWSEYLPEPDDVVNATLSLYSEQLK